MNHETLIESIRRAIAEGASDEARSDGATACRALLAVLDASFAEPIAPIAHVPQTPSTPIAAIASAIRRMPAEQLADLLIAKLRSLVPADQQPTARSIHIPLVGVPR